MAEWKADKLKRVLLGAQLKAATNIQDALNDHPDGDLKWNDVPFRLRASLELAKGSMALERAKAANGGGDGTVRVFGIAVVPARIADRKDWEKLASEAERPAIDAVVVDDKDPE